MTISQHRKPKAFPCNSLLKKNSKRCKNNEVWRLVPFCRPPFLPRSHTCWDTVLLPRPARLHPGPSRLSDHPEHPHEMLPAPRPRGCPTAEAAPHGGDPRGRVPVTLPRHLPGRWQPSERQLGRVPHRAIARQLWDTASRPGYLPWHSRCVADPAPAPARPTGGARCTTARGGEVTTTPGSSRAPVPAVPTVCPPAPAASSRTRRDIHGGGSDGKTPANATQAEIAPAEARTAHQPRSCKYTLAAAAARWDRTRSTEPLPAPRAARPGPSALAPTFPARAMGAAGHPAALSARSRTAPPGTRPPCLCPPAAHRDRARLPLAAGEPGDTPWALSRERSPALTAGQPPARSSSGAASSGAAAAHAGPGRSTGAGRGRTREGARGRAGSGTRP